MALAEALDACFGEQYVPHIYELIYRYAFDVKLAMSDYGGIPYDIYLRLTQEITEIVNTSYSTRYYVNNKLHRLDGPAVTTFLNTNRYYINDKVHRTDGPAEIYSDGTEGYYENGKLHRTDGPAVMYSDGRVEYFIEGVHYFHLVEFERKVAKYKKSIEM